MKRILLSLLLLFTTVAHAQNTVAPSLTPAYFTPQFFGIHVHHPEVPALLPRAQFGAVRMWDGAGTWGDIQPTDGATWSWARMDQYMDALGTAPTMKILLTFGRTPKWAALDKVTPNAAYGAGSASPPADMDDFRLYVRTLATRYKGRIEAYQTGNEANTLAFWQGTVQQLVDLTCAAYQEIKAVDPTALVVMPSGTGAYSPPTLFVKQFLGLGGNACVDVYAYHLYTSGTPPEAFLQPMLDMRASLIAAGYTKPIWDTETGYLMPGAKVGMYASTNPVWSDYEKASLVGDYDAGDFMVRTMLLARALDFQRVYWYAWDNNKMGFIDNGSKLPNDQADVLRRFRAAFFGTGLVGSCTKSSTGIWQCPIQVNTTTQRNGQIVWTDPGATSQVQPFTPAYRANVTTFHSDTITLIPAGTVINVTPTPRLFIWQ